MRYTKWLWVLAILMIQTISAQKKVKIDGVAAVVGSHIVLESDIDKFKLELQQRNEFDVKPTDCQLLEQVMQQKLLAHMAVVDSIKISDAEVDSGVERTLEHFKSQVGDINEVIKLYGFDNLDDLKGELTRIEKENQLISRERQNIIKDVTVTPGEIRFFFNDLKEKGQLPTFGAEVELSQITLRALPTKEAVDEVLKKLKEIKKDVEGGYSMRLKAILYSEDPGVTQNGGLYTLDRQSQFVKEFKEAAFSLEQGEVSEPFKSQFGFHILQVEKVKGTQRDVRHVLLQPKIATVKLNEVKNKLVTLRDDILAGKVSFDEAVVKYSDDDATRFNKGVLVNPYTNDAKFELNKMDPTLFSEIDNLKEGEITQPFYEETRDGDKMYKIVLVKKKYPSHLATLEQDYEKIQQLTLQKKQQETIDKWNQQKIKDTYVKLNEIFKDCDFKYKWF